MFGKLLKVDLSTGAIERTMVPPEYVRQYVGGSGLAACLLYDQLEQTASLDPLDPQNPLLFITGPLTGTAGPTTGRFTVCGRAP